MKRVFNPHSGMEVKNLILLAIRIAIGALLLTHGHPKFMRLISGEPIQFASVMGMSMELSLTLAMFAEFICAILVMFGLFTRLAAIPIIINMLVIVFLIHWDDPFGKKELPLMYLASYVLILFMGAGKYSLDYILHQRLAKARR